MMIDTSPSGHDSHQQQHVASPFDHHQESDVSIFLLVSQDESPSVHVITLTTTRLVCKECDIKKCVIMDTLWSRMHLLLFAN